MFKKEVDDTITMAQRIVALFRDVILGVTILFSAVILYKGGNPSKLNTLQWINLISLAFAVVVVPVVLFIFFKAFINITDRFAYPYAILLDSNFNLARGPFTWVIIKVFRVRPYRYVTVLKQLHSFLHDSSRPSRISKFLFSVLTKTMHYLNRFMSASYPYLISGIFLFALVRTLQLKVISYAAFTK